MLVLRRKRMGGDSNPWCLAAHTLSRRAQSTALSPILVEVDYRLKCPHLNPPPNPLLCPHCRLRVRLSQRERKEGGGHRSRVSWESGREAVRERLVRVISRRATTAAGGTIHRAATECR